MTTTDQHFADGGFVQSGHPLIAAGSPDCIFPVRRAIFDPSKWVDAKVDGCFACAGLTAEQVVMQDLLYGVTTWCRTHYDMLPKEMTA